MKSQKFIGSCCVVLCFVASLLSIPQLSRGSDSEKNTLIGELPSTITDAAKKNYSSGMKLYIWKDNDTKVSIQDLFGQSLIILSGISVLAGPSSDETVFLQCFSLVVKDKETGELSKLSGCSPNQSNKETASSKERRYFGVLSGGTDKKTGKVIQLSGKGTFQVYLADRKEEGKDSPVAISNVIAIEADLDKARP